MTGFLIFGLVVLSTICLWILIEERKSWKFLVWFIPILLVIVTSTYVTYTSILGFPKFGTPEKGMYLRHYVDEIVTFQFEHNVRFQRQVQFLMRTKVIRCAQFAIASRIAKRPLKTLASGLNYDRSR